MICDDFVMMILIGSLWRNVCGFSRRFWGAEVDPPPLAAFDKVFRKKEKRVFASGCVILFCSSPKCWETCGVLLHHRADVNAEDCAGETALHYAGSCF